MVSREVKRTFARALVDAMDMDGLDRPYLVRTGISESMVSRYCRGLAFPSDDYFSMIVEAVPSFVYMSREDFLRNCDE